MAGVGVTSLERSAEEGHLGKSLCWEEGRWPKRAFLGATSKGVGRGLPQGAQLQGAGLRLQDVSPCAGHRGWGGGLEAEAAPEMDCPGFP